MEKGWVKMRSISLLEEECECPAIALPARMPLAAREPSQAFLRQQERASAKAFAMRDAERMPPGATASHLFEARRLMYGIPPPLYFLTKDKELDEHAQAEHCISPRSALRMREATIRLGTSSPPEQPTAHVHLEGPGRDTSPRLRDWAPIATADLGVLVSHSC